MTRLTHPLPRLIALVALPLLAGAPPVAAAPVRKARAVVPAVIKPDNSILPLPLTPTIPVGQRQCATRTPAGLGYTMLRPATGAKPAQTDVVLVNYIGYLASTGAVFDQGTRTPMPVAGVIPGFSQGLQMLSKTGIGRFCIPATLGYGAQATGPIPANADLVFQVELLDYKTAAEVEAMNKAQSAEPTTPAADPAAPAATKDAPKQDAAPKR